MLAQNNHINYIEFKADNLEAIKSFYGTCFNWKFTDYGSDCVTFSNSGMEGGFNESSDKIENGVLIVLYHEGLKLIKK